MRKRLVFAAMAAASLMVLNSVALAGTVILEGSDSIGLHCRDTGGDVGACAYETQTWKALAGASGKPIAAIGASAPGIGSAGSGIIIKDFTTVALAGALSAYSAVYLVSSGGCCSEDDSTVTAAGAAAALTAYLAGGGTVMINNYNGGPAMDFLTGAGGAGLAHVAGISGSLGGPGCTDLEKVTATGTTNGFTQPPVIGCWEHQAYDTKFFGPLGFTKSFFDADPAYAAANPTLGPFSGLLSNGNTVTGGAAPEPASFFMIGAGLVGLGAVLRRRKASAK